MKQNLLFNQASALGKRLAMVLTMLLFVGVGQAWAGDATLTFDNKSKRTTFTTSKQVWEENGITFTNNKASSSNNVADYANPARMYAGSSVTVACSLGNMTQIVFDCNSSSYATAMNNSIGDAATVSSDKVTVTLDGTSNTFSVDKLTAQVRLDAITVIYEEEVTCTEITPSLTYSSTTLEIGSTATPTLEGNTGNGTVTYSSNNTTVATVNASTGVVTANAAGTATITATIAANGDYCEGTATATIKVNKQSATIVLSEAGTENTESGTFYKDDSYTLPSSTDAKCGDKVLVGWSIVKVEETDTKPTSNYYDKGTSVSLKAGENKFYAVFATESETTGGTTTIEETATLSFASTDQRTTYTTSKQVWEQNGITLTNDKGSSTSNVADYSNPARFYKSSKITVSFTSEMTQIVFVCSSSDYATELKNSIKSGANVTLSGSNVTALLTSPTTSFVIASLSGQVRMKSLEVTYKTTTSGGNTITYSDYTTECSTETTVYLHPNFGSEPATQITTGAPTYTVTDCSFTRDGYTFSHWDTKADDSGIDYEPGDNIDLDGTDVNLYAQWTSNKTATSLSWSADSYSATIDAVNTFPALTKSPADLSPIAYSSSNTGVATIDADGEITLVEAGTTTITATFTETNTHAGATATYILTVNPSNCRWVETVIANIQPEDEVLVVMEWGETLFTMANDGGASGPRANTITTNDLATNSVEETVVWNISKNDDGTLTFYPYGATNKWLYCTADYVGVGNNVNNKFTIENGYLMHYGLNRYLAVAVNAGTKYWQHYALESSIVQSQTLKFYKRECLDSEHYWVTWDAGEGLLTDGSSKKLESYAVGDDINRQADPSREGYRFDGWHDGTAVVEPATTMGTSNLTYTAQWTKVYTVTFYNNGGVYETLTNLESGATVVFPTTDPTSCDTEIYPHFIGWTINPINGSTDEKPDLVTSATVSDEDLEYHAVFAAGTPGTISTKVDVLNRELTGIEGTSYSEWSGKTATSSAVYAGQSAGGANDNPCIQLRSNNSNSGIITTTSGGKATKVVVTWNNSTASGRTLNVYGKNSAYTAATDLYNENSGTLLGTIVCGTSTELTINGDYEYIGMRSASGAMYLDEIQIRWSAGSAANYTSFITSCCQSPAVVTVTPADASLELNIDGTASTTVNISQTGGGNGKYYEPTVSPMDGASLGWSGSYKTQPYDIDFTATKAGTYTITGNFTETSYGCQKTGSATINVVANPILLASASELTFSPTCGQNSAIQEVEINSRYLTANSITATVATTSGSGKFTISTDNTTFGTSNLTLSGGTTTKVTDQIYVRYEAEEGETGAVAGTLTLKCGSTQQVINLTGTCTCSANVTITGGPIQITAAEGVWVEAATELTVTGTFLTTNANNANVSIRAYTNNTAFQIKKGGVTGEGSNNALTLNTDGAISTADWTGNIAVVYKPTQANTTETATLTVEVYRHNGTTIYSTATYELEGRSLPEQFVIAVTNGSGDWFAVPADMIAPWGENCSGLGTFAPYPISVDNTTAPTIASDVPARAVYQATARTGNVNTNPQTMSYKSVPLGGNYYLYGSSTSVDSDGNNTNIQNASFAASEKQKWFLDVVDWNTKQYNMHVHSSLTTYVLAYTTAGGTNRVGQYSATAGTTKKSIYLLPINGTTCTYYAAPVVTVTAIDATNATIQFKNDRTTAYEISLDQNTWTDLPVTLIKDCNNSEEATLLQAQLPLATYRGQTVYIRAKVTTGTACQETGSFVVPNPTIDRGESPWKYTGTAGKAFSDNSKSITISDLWNPLSVSVVQQRTNSNIQASITPEGVVTVSMAAEDATEGVHEAILQFISDGASFVDNGKGNPQYVGVQITLYSLAEMNFDGGNGAFDNVNGTTMLCKEKIDGGITPKIYLNDALCLDGNYISTTEELNQTTFSLVDLNSGASLSFERDGTNGGYGGGIASVTFNASTIAAMIPGHTYRLSWENTNQVMTNVDGLPYMDCYMDFVYSENCDAPTALAACPITQTSFTANWIDAADCTGDVTVDVYTKSGSVLASKSLKTSVNNWAYASRSADAWGLVGTSNSSSNSASTYGWGLYRGGVNYIYSPEMSYISNTIDENVIVTVTATVQNTKASTYYLKVGAATCKNNCSDTDPTFNTISLLYFDGVNTATQTYAVEGNTTKDIKFTIKGLTSASMLQFTTTATTISLFLQNVDIAIESNNSVATKTASCSAGSAEFTGLSANTTYYYTVTDGSSNTSNEIAVTTYNGEPELKFYSDEAWTNEITETTVLGGEETIVYVKGSNVPACDITPIISSGYGMDYSNISYTTGTGAVSGSIILTLADANTTEGTLTITDAEGNDYVLNIVSSDCPAGFGTMALPATNITNESAQANWITTLDFGDDKSGTLHLYKNGVVNRELIVNGDFETGSLAEGWSNGINNGEVGAAHSFDQYTIKNSSSEAYDGNYSLYVTADGSTLTNFYGQSVMYADYITLTPGTYRMSAWVKMPTANGYDDKTQYFSLGIITGKNGSEHVYTVSTPVTVYSNNTYVQLTHEFEVTSTITACPAIGASSGTFRYFYLDDVSLVCTSIGQSDEPYLSIDIADLSDAGNLALTDLSGNTEYTYVIQNAAGCSSNPITFQTTEAGAPVITPNDVAISCQVGGSVNGIMTLTVKDVYGDIYISNSCTERIKLKTTQLPKEGGVVNFTFTPLTTDEGGTTGTCIISFTTKGMSTPAEGVITWTVTAGKDPNQPNVEVVDITNESMDIEHNQGDDNNVHIVISREKGEDEIEENLGEEIFFSKYYEAYMHKKLWAIYNPTNHPISLANTYVWRSNGKSTEWNTENGLDLSGLGNIEPGYIHPNEEIIIYTADQVGACEQSKADMSDWVAMSSSDPALSFSGDDALLLVRKDVTGDADNPPTESVELDSNGDPYELSWRRYTDAGGQQWWMLDIIGARKNDNTPDNSATYTWNWTCNGKTETGDAAGWVGTGEHLDATLYTDCPYVLSTNRCLLIRKMTVKSGYKAILNNVGDMQTLNTEWRGAHVPRSGDQEAVSCENFSFVGGYDYDSYYNAWTPIDEMDYIDAVKNDDGSYTISPINMPQYYCHPLRIEVYITENINGEDVNDVKAYIDYKVPIVVDYDTDTSDPDYFSKPTVDNVLTDAICAECDVVIRDGAKLTHIEDGRAEFRTMQVYPTAKFEIPAGLNMQLEGLHMYAKNDEVGYAIINNDGSSIHAEDIIHIKRIDDMYWYPFSLPYDCKVSSIYQINGKSMGKYWVDWGIKYYDGEARQQEGDNYAGGATSKFWKQLDASETLKAHQGYIIGLFTTEWPGQMKSIYFPPVENTEYTEGGNDAKTTYISNWSDNLTCEPRHRGWNFTGLPYISLFSSQNGDGITNNSSLMMGSQTDDYATSSIVYVSIPDGGDSRTYTQVSAASVKLEPFKPYFVQAMDPKDSQSHDDIALTYSKGGRTLDKIQARSAASTQATIMVELVVANQDATLTDNAGVLANDRYTENYEIAADLMKMYAEDRKPQLFTRAANNEMMAYNALPDCLAQNIPLGLFVPEAGEYTISILGYASQLADAEAAYLLYEGEIVANLLYSDYTIVASQRGLIDGYHLDIRRKQKTITDINNLTDGAPVITIVDGQIVIQQLPDNAEVQIIDVLGRVLYQQANVPEIITFQAPATGVYNVVITTTEQQFTHKTIIR